MKIITYRVKLLESALVTTLDGDPNSAVAFGFLPGSVLRGSVIQQYLATNGVNAKRLLDHPGAMRLFFDGTTRYLNGYLMRDGARLLPAPLSWQRPKGEASTITDTALAAASADKRWEGVGAMKFCKVEAAQASMIEPLRHLAVHTARDRIYGRARKQSGAVYRYESLAAGQTFEAAIVCDTDADADTLLPLLSGEVTLGGSRSGGYGQARIESAAVVTDPAAWRECGSGALTAAPALVVTLLSDALVRDANGQYGVNLETIAGALREKLSDALIVKDGFSFLRGRATGGFNRKWGLPLPQAVSVQMGSVIVFDASKIDAAQMQTLIQQASALECAGFGERRAEGFGRVAVNWQSSPMLSVTAFGAVAPKGTAADVPPRLKQVQGDGRALAERMVRRMTRRRLDDQVTALANEIDVKHPPSRAQLSRLRSVVYDELRKPIPDPADQIGKYLRQVQERAAARKAFERARVGETHTLIQWLENTAKISVNDLKARLGAGDGMIAFDETLRGEYALRLIDAVLARAAKQARKEEG